MQSLIKCGVLMTLLVPLGACGGNKPVQDPYAASRTTTTTSATYDPRAVAEPAAPDTMRVVENTFGGGPNAGIDATPPPVKPERLLTDAEILAFTSEVRMAATAMAELAKRNAVDNDVKNYAAVMLTLNRDVETKEKSVSRKAKLTPAESDVSSQLKDETHATIAALRKRRGNEFDRAYIESQVRAHQNVLEAIDIQLLPSVQNSELKTFVTQLRQQIAGELAKAEEIKQRLQ